MRRLLATAAGAIALGLLLGATGWGADTRPSSDNLNPIQWQWNGVVRGVVAVDAANGCASGVEILTDGEERFVFFGKAACHTPQVGTRVELAGHVEMIGIPGAGIVPVFVVRSIDLAP